MRGLFFVVALLVGANFLHAEYTKPSCGTADVCGAPFHDFLHRVIR